MSLIGGALAGYRNAHEGQLGDAFGKQLTSANSACFFTQATAAIVTAQDVAMAFDTDQFVSGFTKVAAGRFAVLQAGYYLVLAKVELDVSRNWGIHDGTSYRYGSNAAGVNSGDSAHVFMYLPVGAELSVRTVDVAGMSAEVAASNGSKNWLGAFRLL